METQIENDIGCYYRAVIFCNEKFQSSFDLFKGKDIDTIQKEKDVFTYNITVNHETQNLPEFWRKIFNKNNEIKKYKNTYPIKLLGIEIKRGDKIYFFIASPIKDILSEEIDKFNNHYQLLNLKKLFNHNFSDDDRKLLRITRVNAKIKEETSKVAQSITLFGEDIVKSSIFKYIVEGILWDRLKGAFGKEEDCIKRERIENVDITRIKGGPFMSTDENFRLKIEPSSCRVTNVINNREKYGINIDKYGNFSFYLKQDKTLKYLLYILSILLDLDLFTNHSLINPLERSEESLIQIENGEFKERT